MIIGGVRVPRSAEVPQAEASLVDRYTIIYADPPWSYNDKGFGKRENGAESGSFAPEAGRYTTMSLGEILAMRPFIDSFAATDCALFLWVTSPLLPEGLQTMREWGFKYKTVAFCWSKVTSNGKEVANLGQWTMGNIELCLVGTRGRPKRQSRNVRQLCRAARTIHSRKPAEVRERIVALMGDVPRIELFAREHAVGWKAWGLGVVDEAPPTSHVSRCETRDN